MHPELNLQAVQLRHVELTRRHHTAPVRRPSWFARRRRATPAVVATQRAAIVLLPPPREEHERAGRDQRVA